MPEPIRLLVAEDDPADTLLLREAFARIGVQGRIQFVRDGQEAVDLLASLPRSGPPERGRLPSLLLLDLKMPRLDGFDVLTWVRQQPGLRHLPVVVFSSSREPQDITRAYELGANSYLVKPHDFDQLLALAEGVRDYWLGWNLTRGNGPAQSGAC